MCGKEKGYFYAYEQPSNPATGFQPNVPNDIWLRLQYDGNMEPQRQTKEAERPVVVAIKRAQAGSLDTWLRSLRQPGPPAQFSKSGAQMLHEARAER